MTGALRIQLWKELRALLPWWAGIVFTVAVASVVGGRQTSHDAGNGLLFVAIFAYAAGCASLGALSIGHEYSHRTLAGLLASPADRRTILAQKSVVLTSLIAILLAVAALTFATSHAFPVYRDPISTRMLVYGPALAGLLLAPWLTMLCRGVLAGSVFTIAIPMLIALTTNAFSVAPEVTWRGFLILAALGGVMTWRSFLRLPVVDGPEQSSRVTTLLERPMPDQRATAQSSQARGWFGLVLRKELHLQQITFAVAALYVAGWTLLVLSRRLDPSGIVTGPSHFGITSLHGGIIAIMAGALPAAEERQYGTADWQILLPTAAWKQWTFKVVLAVAIANLLAIGLPALLQSIHASPDDIGFDVEQVVGVTALTLAGLYVSSISSTGLRAILATVPGLAAILLAATVLTQPIGMGVQHLVEPFARTVVKSGSIGPRTVWRIAGIAFMVYASLMSCLVMTLAFHNYRSADRGRRRFVRQIVLIVGFAVAGAVLLTALMNFLEAGVARPLIQLRK